MGDINDYGSESKISQTEKLAPVLEGVRHDGPAWEKTSFSRSAERVGAEQERQGQDRVSDISVIGPLKLTSTSNSKPGCLVLDDDTEQAPANNKAGSGLTSEIMSAGKRRGVNETHSNSTEQSVRGGLRSLTAEGSDVVDVPSRRNSAGDDNATNLAESSCFLGGVPRQRGDDAERPGLSTESRRNNSPEKTSSALLLVEGQAHGAQGGAARTKSCTTQLKDNQQGGRERTSLGNTRGTSTIEQASQAENIGEFHALLREAMQQSDAELAAEKESACTFKRQLSLPALTEYSPHHQCGSPPETLQPVTSTSNIAEDCYRKDCGSGGTDFVSDAAHMDAPPPASAPLVPLSETTQGQWIRYISPEGHPYLYNEMTGSSRWADPSEEELLQTDRTNIGTAVTTAVTTAVDTGRGAVDKVAETERADYNDEDGGTDGTGSIDVDEEERGNVVEEVDSACTCEASQTSQDTSDPDARNSAGETAMHLAAAQHSVRGLRLLLTGGANVNARDEGGRTPLHVACENRHRSTNDYGSNQSRECVELLLSRGAMEDARDAKGQTPLHISASAGNLGAAQALVGVGAIASADAAGNSPLHLAAAQGHSEIIKLLVLGNRACDTRKSSSVASEEVPSPKLAHDEEQGSCAATMLATEGTDASGSVSEPRYRPSDRPLLADGRCPLDRVGEDSSFGDYPYGREALQTPDNLYQQNAIGTSRQKQQRGLSGAEGRAPSEPRTNVEDFPTNFGADIPMKVKRPGNLSISHPVGGPEAVAGVALCDGSPSCGLVGSSYQDSGYLTRNTEIMREETDTVEYRRSSHEGRRVQGTPVETKVETRRAPTVSFSARVRENRRSWDEGPRKQSLPHRRHDRLSREFGHLEVNQSGIDKLEMREWPSKNVGDTRRTREEGGEEGARKCFLDHNHERQRPEGKGRKANRRSLCRQRSDRDDQEVPWPEALPPDIYDQIVGAVLATRSEDPGTPPYSALTEALSAACVASRLDDVAAVLRLLEIQGRETPDIVYEGGRTPLHHACRGDDVSLVRLLCRARADPGARDFQGNSPLIVAAAAGSTSCLRFLLQGGVDPDGCNELGDTPLHVAASHGNLSCVKVLVGGGARLSQRNRSGLTAREGLLNAGPTFSRGRPPKVIRATLKYMECAEASATQSTLPTWASKDGYHSDCTAVTAASRTSPERSNDIDISGSKADISLRRGISSNEAVGGALNDCPGARSTPVARGDREREGERNWERCRPREERKGGARERRREENEIFSITQRRGFNVEECFARNGNLGRAERKQLHDPYGPYGGGHATSSARNDGGSLAPHFEPSRESYNSGYSVAEGDFSANQAVTQVDYEYGVGEHDARRRYERTTARDETPDASSDSYGSRHTRVEQEATPNVISSTPSRAGSGVWSAVGRAFDYIISGGDGRDERDGSGSNTENGDCALNKPPSNHPTWRPPTDSELREGTEGMASSLSSLTPMPRKASAGATCADATGDSRHVDTPLETESHDTKVPLSLTPMQPPPDVLAAMKARVATGQRQRFSAPPADVAAAIDNAAEKRQRDYVL